MKYLFLCFIFLLKLNATNYAPSWFPKNNYTIKSYGQGNTLDEAKISAFNDFIRNNNELNSTIISEFTVSKEEIFENHFFIEMTYNNKSINQQLKDEINNIVFKLDDETNKFLLNTNLFLDLNNTYGYYPKINIKDNLIYFNGKTFIIKNSEFSLFLHEYASEEISLEMKASLSENEKYFLKINTKKDGFLNLVQIINNTDVEFLFSNKFAKPNIDIVYPNFKMSDGLEINLQEDKINQEIYTIAFLCDKKKDFSNFSYMFLTPVSTKNMFGNFINLIGDCNYSSFKTIINKYIE